MMPIRRVRGLRPPNVLGDEWSGRGMKTGDILCITLFFLSVWTEGLFECS